MNENWYKKEHDLLRKQEEKEEASTYIDVGTVDARINFFVASHMSSSYSLQTDNEHFHS